MANSSYLKDLTIARSPFRDEVLADIIVTTSDNVDFYLVKAVLALASPFFRDMFSLTQPPKHETGNSVLERIPVSESSEVFDTLMRYCYPVDHVGVADLALVEGVLEAALKYQIPKATNVLKEVLKSFLDLSPLRVFAISCRLGCEHEARLAAKKWKTRVGWNDGAESFSNTTAGRSLTDETSLLSAGQYNRLLNYIRSGLDLPTPFIHEQSSATSPVPDVTSLRKSGLTPDTNLRSSDGIDFPIHSAVFHLAGIPELLAQGKSAEMVDGLPLVNVDLRRSALSDLILICYPLGITTISSIPRLSEIVRAARKYNSQSVLAFARNLFAELSGDDPLNAYFVASQVGWTKEALDAARSVAERGLEMQYASTMEDATAKAYSDLLHFCHRYRAAFVKGTTRAAPIVVQEQWKKMDFGGALWKGVLGVSLQLAFRAGDRLDTTCVQCGQGTPLQRLPIPGRTTHRTYHWQRPEASAVPRDVRVRSVKAQPQTCCIIGQ